jgi:hypothetical protein
MTQLEVRPEAQLEPIQLAERKLVKSIIWGVGIAVPLCMLIWIGLVSLALATSIFTGSWGSSLAIGAVVGAFGGAFFGGWAGSLIAAHDLDDADRPSH